MAIRYQHPNTQSPDGFEMIEVSQHRIACDGGDGALGHPTVYLQIDHATGEAVCPYCSCRFVYTGHQVA